MSATFLALILAAVTPGWEDINPKRNEIPATRVVWTAPLDGFSVEKLDGAEGEATTTGGVIRIRKTNAEGRIVVKAPTFNYAKGRKIRLFADVSSLASKPKASGGFLCAYGAQKLVTKRDTIGRQWFAAGGDRMVWLINSAPGMTYRKYSHFEPDGAPVTPVIAVEGAPSESEWRNWSAEDLDAAQAAWEERKAKMKEKNRRNDMMDDAEFSRLITEDIDHVAEIRTVEGTSRLFVDGIETPPIIYKSSSEVGSVDGAAYAGKPLQRAGVRIGVINLRLGEMPTSRGPWSERGFDVASAVETVRRSMRAGNESCFILAIGTSAYPAFTAEHPDDVWRREDGSVVLGNSGSAIPDKYNDGGSRDPDDKRWPWVSYASPAWRSAIKDITARLFSELRRQNLLKRIVGVHFYGYHDGQFAVPVADHSSCAKAEWRRYLEERGLKEGMPGSEYEFFMKQIGFRALEDFSRAAKREIGKPAIAVRWCMLPFCGLEGSYDIGSFIHSDVVDVIVPQPTYTQRPPAMAQGVRLPCDSLHRHGKMMWYEFDLRTWTAYDAWARSAVALKGLGQADDIAMWRTMFRKHAGIMMAQRMGWWLYDMAGGWFASDEIVDDVKEVRDTYRAVSYAPKSAWRPDAAIVIDELALALCNRKGFPPVPDQPTMVIAQWPRTALSGVPYDVILAEDIEKDSSLAKRYKAIALCGFTAPDARQKRIMKAVDDAGASSFVVRPGGFTPEFFHDFTKDAGGYVATRPGGVQVDMNGNFISVHCVVPGRYGLRLPFPANAVNAKTWHTEKVEDGVLSLEMSAGETCWFVLVPLPKTSPVAGMATDAVPRFSDEHPHRLAFWWARRMAEKRSLVEARAAKGKAVFDLVMLGDSITHFWEYQGQDIYTSLTNSFSVINLGYGGDNTRSVIWRLENNELAGLTAKNVMLMIGTNNHHDSPQSVADGIEKIVNLIAKIQPQAKVLLVSIPPRALKGRDDTGPRRRNEAVNSIIKRFADGKRIVWIDMYNLFLNSDGTLRKNFYKDGLHLSRDGFRAWRDAILPELKK